MNGGIKMAREMKRLNTNMPVKLVERIDVYAERMCISRSSAINILCNVALDNLQLMGDLNKFVTLYDEASKKNANAE
jgi:metal-responsive CopG/Arc/MetJ family transcriptional regulator